MTGRARTGEPRSFVYSFFTSSSPNPSSVCSYITYRCKTSAWWMYREKGNGFLRPVVKHCRWSVFFSKFVKYLYIEFASRCNVNQCFVNQSYLLWSNYLAYGTEIPDEFASTQVYKSFHLNLATAKGNGVGLPFKSGTRPPTAVIGAQIKSRNAR